MLVVAAPISSSVSAAKAPLAATQASAAAIPHKTDNRVKQRICNFS